mmetsp:Transcript_13069/g.28338  ORF Transcript_13069/g.28338 Transcript_13069/m.28338 type:complete len:349 (-) Transcript_13069:207-1253(-)
MTSTEEIPTTMKRLVVSAPGKDVASCKIEVSEVPVPEPSSGEVLIKVVAAPINPSDYGEWFRSSPDKYPLPMGKEGCGIVVSIGGVTPRLRFSVGSKVGFIGLKGGQGSYSEYVAIAATGCFAMPDDMPIEDCASFFVNPYTALAILDTAKQQGSPAIVHTAAASQLGQMMVKVAPSEDVEVINVVRREEQAELLRELGAEHVVVTGGDEAKWKEELKDKVKQLGATCAFDAVSGSMTGNLLGVMPPNGTVYTYGGLAGLAGNINPMDLIYRHKKLKGFLVADWIQDGGMLRMIPRMLSASRKVNDGLKSPGWSSTQFMDTTLEKAHDDIVKLLASSITGKKLRIRFD